MTLPLVSATTDTTTTTTTTTTTQPHYRYSQLSRGDVEGGGGDDASSLSCLLRTVLVINVSYIVLLLLPALVALFGALFHVWQNQGFPGVPDWSFWLGLLLVTGGIACAGLGINGAIWHHPCRVRVAGAFYLVQLVLIALFLLVVAHFVGENVWDLFVDGDTAMLGCLVVAILLAVFAGLHFVLVSKMLQ